MSSSKRGRKRNDSLPPNRARDVQRAFRARRAAHLQALEQRVMELEEENTCFRQALNLPAAIRPPLGKGPTGKDKPKPYDDLTPMFSRDSSSNSPNSIETGSLSPESRPAVVLPRALHTIEGAGWEQSMLLSGEQHADIPDSPYQNSTPNTSKNHNFHSYSSQPSRSTPSVLMSNSQLNYPHALSRNYENSVINMRGHSRNEYMPVSRETSVPRSMGIYSDSGYESHEVNMHHSRHVNSPPLGTLPRHQLASSPAYMQRRVLNGTLHSQPFESKFRPELPNSVVNSAQNNNIRLPSPPHLSVSDSNHL